MFKDFYGDHYGIVKYGSYKDWTSDDEFTEHVGFYVEFQGTGLIRKDLGFWCNNSEKVGNIHDNPELLED